ncbi:GNAT family N-acetyltransferase, cg3035/Rv0428c family [Gordonia sp. NPDC003376]
MSPDPFRGVPAFRGDRVVVRYLLGATTPADWRPTPDPASAGAPTRSDVTGLLVDRGDPVRLERDGVIESIPWAAISSIRLLSAVPVRNSEIRTLERVMATAGAGSDHEWIGGWLVRADGPDPSAVPLERTAYADTVTLTAIEMFYTARGLPVLLSIPERLLPRQVDGTPVGPEIHVLTCDLTDVREVGDDTTPVRHDARDAVVSTAVDGARWAGISAIDDAALADRMAWAAAHGAAHAYSRLAADDAAAGDLCRARGFTLHHRSRHLHPAGPAR